jgi:transcriptional regulator with XRE-family HTH domain
VPEKPQTFGDRLKAERERKKMTPGKLASEAGVTPQYVHNLENNLPNKGGTLTQPSTDVCIRFANALGIHYLEVLRWAGHIPADITEAEVKARVAGDYVAALPEEKQVEALNYLKFLFEKFGDSSKMRELSPRNPAVVRDEEQAPPPVARTAPRQRGKGKDSRRRGDEQTHSKPAAKNGSDDG